ncbi:MAG: hypothetical protein L3K19_00155 [Thermoplasmata archaeon]|nr:hypothetical protein [Thermoplasmata archaeon]
MAASSATPAPAPPLPVSILGRAGSKYPLSQIGVGLAVAVIAAAAYLGHDQLGAAVPWVVGLLVPALAIGLIAIWSTIMIFHGPPDHLKSIPYIGLPGAIFVFALEGVGLYILGWAGLIEALSSQSGGLAGVPPPESWAVPAASGGSWFAISVVVIVYYARVNLYDPWLVRRGSSGSP